MVKNDAIYNISLYALVCYTNYVAQSVLLLSKIIINHI